MTKVLLIAPTADGEDVGESWVGFQWVRLLAEASDLTLLTSYKKGHTPPSRQIAGVRVIEWPEPPLVDKFERFNSLLQPGYVSFYARARRWIKKALAAGESFDVAHQVIPVAMRYPSPAVGLGIPLVIGPVGGSLSSPPAFVEEEGATPWYQRLRSVDRWRLHHDPLLRRTYEGAACVIGIAPYVGEHLDGLRLRRMAIMAETAINDVQPPIDRSDRTGTVKLLHVGRIVRTKGLRDLIRAMHEVRDLDVALDVVGQGNDRDACESLSEQLGLTDRIVFHGAIPRAEVDAFYAGADAFAFPSYREPGGNVPLEAMSYGLPLIVCKRGGPGAETTDACAFRLAAESPQQLTADCAAAIRRLVQEPKFRLHMGAAGREHVATHHLWSARLERMLQIYNEVADSDGAATKSPS